MKRLIFIASLAMLAVGCQKTEIQNEVLTPIGFSTEVGKQTRAIVQDGTYDTEQPFAVYAYGHQGNAAATTVMDNVEVSYQTDTWKATSGSYYWPNDPSTTLNFYAYSPALVDTPTAQNDHQKLNGTITHFETAPDDGSATAGFSLTAYQHTNMYVDFMVATPVLNATFGHPDGSDTQSQYAGTAGTVPLTFNHEMTQILFKVTTDKVYPGVTFTVEEVTLKNIKDQGTYTHASLTPSYTNDPQTSAFTHGVWSGQTVMAGEGTFTIFPADTDNGAVVPNGRVMSDTDNTVEKEIELTYAANATDASALAEMTTTGVTMIPQILVASTPADQNTGASAVNGQSFTIVYRIEGTGVASETVTKTVDLYTDDVSTVHWEANKKITYTVKIGLNEILFEPSVAEWTTETGNEYTFQQ